MIPPCVICGRSTPVETRHDNHDPRPLVGFGRCCGWCNTTLVMPARQREWFDKRASMVRLVVAQQWAVAIALLDRVYVGPEGRHVEESWRVYPDVWGCQRLAALPCAEDVVAEALGER